MAITKAKNKMIGGAEPEVKNKQKFFSPELQTTVEASDLEEAQKIINKLKQK